MGKVKLGDQIASFNVDTIAGVPVTLPITGSKYTHLQFRRFAGCPVCNFHLLTMARRQEEIAAAGISEVVVFHSHQDEMVKYQAQLPFHCVADPDKRLYRQFGVENSLWALLHPGVLLNGAKWVIGQRRFYRKAENGIFGLPADILVNRAGRVVAVQYGSHADDQWSVDDLLKIASFSA